MNDDLLNTFFCPQEVLAALRAGSQHTCRGPQACEVMSLQVCCLMIRGLLRGMFDGVWSCLETFQKLFGTIVEDCLGVMLLIFKGLA